MSVPSPESEMLDDSLPETDVLDSDGHAEMDAEDLVKNRRLHWRAWVYGLVSVLIVMFGTGREPWARGLALLLMGTAMVIAPPRIKLPLLPALALFLLALAPGVGLLPVSAFGGAEEWRQALSSEWGISMPATLSPEWRLTLEAWLVTVVGVAWFWSCLGQNFSDGGRLLVLWIVSLAALLIGVMTLLDNAAWLDIPWWSRGDGGAGSFDDSGFGPFANQNHSSSLFAWASVLCAAAAVDAFKRGSRLWVLLGAGVLLLLGCILLNSSRAGLLLFFLGMTLWLATAAMKRGFFRKLIVISAMVLAIISVVMVSGGRVGERLKERPVSEAVGQDLRLWLARETLNASTQAPWTGRGLGTFDHVFPQVRVDYYPDARTTHPDSDVLWVLFEGGLLFLLPCLVLVGWLFRTTGPWFASSSKKKRSRDSRAARRVRRAFGIASALALAHSIFDVPLHGLGYFVLFAVVTAQAVRGRYLAERISPLIIWLFRGVGVAVAVWGGLWLALVAGVTEFSTASAATLFHDRAVEKAAAGGRAEALQLVNRAIELTPLEYRWYFLRAQLHLTMRHGSAAALQDFGRVRALEPHFGPVCFEEGRYWLHFDPPMALIAWQEGMRRYPAEFSNAIPLYQSIMIDSAPFPEIAAQLWKVADRPSLKLVFLAQMYQPEVWRRCQQEFLGEHPAMTGLSKPQIRYFFHLWQHKGDRKQLIEYLEKHPQLQEFGWQILAQNLASSGKFEEACRLAARFIPSPARSATLTAADVPRLERSFLLNPIDPLPGVELYYAQRAAGDLKSARRTLEKVMSLPKSPEFLSRELVAVLVELGDMRTAWEIMQRLVAQQETVDMGVFDDSPDDADAFERPATSESGKQREISDVEEGL